MRTSLRRRNHSILVPLACLLLVATALALIGIAQSLADTSFERTPSSEVALQGTNRFYDAVNTVVRTGDVGALNAIVSSDFVDHVSNFGLASGREGLIQLLLARHETMPRSSLVIDQALAVGNEVAVRVHVESDSAGVFLGLPLPSTAQEWGLQETLRIENGAVVERWGSASRSLQAQPLWQLLCPTPDAQTSRRVLYLKHVLLVPDAHQLLSDETATQLVFVGSGQLTSVGEPRTHLGNGQPIPLPIKRSGPAASPAVNERAYSQFGDPVILAPGDFVEIPPAAALRSRTKVLVRHTSSLLSSLPILLPRRCPPRFVQLSRRSSLPVPRSRLADSCLHQVRRSLLNLLRHLFSRLSKLVSWMWKFRGKKVICRVGKHFTLVGERLVESETTSTGARDPKNRL